MFILNQLNHLQIVVRRQCDKLIFYTLFLHFLFPQGIWRCNSLIDPFLVKKRVCRRMIIVLVVRKGFDGVFDQEWLVLWWDCFGLWGTLWKFVILEHVQNDIYVYSYQFVLILCVCGLLFHLLGVWGAHGLFVVLLEPRMFSNLCNWISGRRIGIENLLNQILGGTVHIFWKSVLALQYFLVQFIRVRILKGQISTNHSIQYHTTWPYIDFQSVILPASNHLWSCITRASARCLQQLPGTVHIR